MSTLESPHPNAHHRIAAAATTVRPASGPKLNQALSPPNSSRQLTAMPSPRAKAAAVAGRFGSSRALAASCDRRRRLQQPHGHRQDDGLVRPDREQRRRERQGTHRTAAPAEPVGDRPHERLARPRGQAHAQQRPGIEVNHERHGRPDP